MDQQACILVVDDDADIVNAVRLYLEKEGFCVYGAADGFEALDVLEQRTVHLILMDVMMPRMDGFSAILRIRQKRNLPILVMSAKTEDSDKVLGLSIGADDYISKPFSPTELVARVKVVLNRTLPKTEAEGGVYTFGGLTVDSVSHSVKIDGQEASLTPKEFDLLVFLATNRGIALSREKILQKVWNYDYYGEDRTVDTHIKMLRSHLGRYRDAIVTVWGIGYKFDPEAVK